MEKQRQPELGSRFLLIALGALVTAFMGISLAVTTTGTARFAIAMGYPPQVAYIVGGIFDVAKSLLPVALIALLERRNFLFFVLIGSAWIGLATYSCLATHATVTNAITAMERIGIWKTESRTNAKAELAAVEQRLVAISQPTPPRPSKTLIEMLAIENVPSRIWRESKECQRIRDSRYFQVACATIVKLRRELATAEDYERLDAEARTLRQALAATPVVASADPLPDAFTATLGRFLPVDGRSGVALLLTIVIEILSGSGFAMLRVLREEENEGRAETRGGLEPDDCYQRHTRPGTKMGKPLRKIASSPKTLDSSVLEASLEAGGTGVLGAGDDKTKSSPRLIRLPSGGRGEGQSACERTNVPPSSKNGLSLGDSHVLEFVSERLESAVQKSVAAAELWSAYLIWCSAQHYVPMSRRQLGTELKGLGYGKWKSCGLIRYRNVQLVA